MAAIGKYYFYRLSDDADAFV